MPNYKEMYLKMVRATETALNLLINAQQECEELYISTPNSEEDIVEDYTDKENFPSDYNKNNDRTC